MGTVIFVQLEFIIRWRKCTYGVARAWLCVITIIRERERGGGGQFFLIWKSVDMWCHVKHDYVRCVLTLYCDHGWMPLYSSRQLPAVASTHWVLAEAWPGRWQCTSASHTLPLVSLHIYLTCINIREWMWYCCKTFCVSRELYCPFTVRCVKDEYFVLFLKKPQPDFFYLKKIKYVYTGL